MSAAEAAIDSMTKASAMPCVAPSGTATCPEGRIRIGVFFDGTGNNMWRDWPNGVANSPNPDGDLTGPTNVAKLWHLFIEKGDIQKRVYHHGPGTDTYGDKPRTDHPGWIRRKINATLDAPGMLLGSGGKARTTWGLLQLSEFFSKNNNPLAPQKLVDVYGFSRGSAIARDFINRALLEGIDNLKKTNGYRYITVPGGGMDGGATAIRVQAYERHAHVIMDFLGVFDTVASFNLGGKEAGNFEYNFFINHNDVRHTVHMVAEDEVRALFPVSSLFMDPKGKDPQKPSDYIANLLELWYPGAHSDVGGSYLPVPAIPGKSARTEYIYSEFGAQPYQVPEVKLTPPKNPELAHIPLRDMHKASVDMGVPLEPLKSLGTDHLWVIPGDLLEQYDAYDAYRAETPFAIGSEYIQNFEINEYMPLYHAQRAAQKSVAYLEVNYMHDTRMGLLGDKREKHKRTVLYMGRQPATNPKGG